LGLAGLEVLAQQEPQQVVLTHLYPGLGSPLSRLWAAEKVAMAA
jgi:hypothetical protein